MTEEARPLGGGGRGGGGGGGGGTHGPFQQAVLLHFGADANEITADVAVPGAGHLLIETVTAESVSAPVSKSFSSSSPPWPG
ncbi:MAG: hypothetical protein NVSMB29_04790 [Candidatus Dormibacteria bacterium]